MTGGQEWRAYWTLVLSAMIGVSLGTVLSTSLGLFMQPLSDEFGWSRSEISSGMLVFALITTPLTPFAGALVDRFGPRRIAVPGVALTALALAAFSLVGGAIVVWLTAWAVYSIFSLGIRTIVWNSAVSASFNAARGMAIALTLCGTALATTAAPLLTHWLIEAYGWRTAYAALGLGWGGLAFLLVLLFFHDARSRAARAVARGDSAPTAARLPGGMTLAQACRDWRMIRIAFAMSMQTLMGAAVLIHMVPLLVAAGLTRIEAASVASILGVMAIASRLLVGALLDRSASPFIPAACFVLPAVGYAILLQSGGSLPLLALAVATLGLGSGGCLQVATYITTRYAGVRHFGKIFGIISSLLGLTGGLGPVIAGLVFDTTGAYTLLVTAGIPLALLAGLAVFGLGPYPQYEPEPVAEPARAGAG
jgi:MFS family permease